MSAELLQATLFCSDINEKTILSVNCDTIEESFILVTCRAFIKRYNVMHRTPVNSWSTKSWDPFTTGAIRDPESKKITAVINGASLYQWDVEQKEIADIKKLKFKSTIHSFISSSDNSAIFVLFTSGHIQRLDLALSLRKEKLGGALKEDDEKIVGQQILKENTLSAVLLQNKNGDLRLCLNKIAADANYSATPTYLSVSHGQCKLTASSILGSGSLITLWNDGNLFCMDIFNNSTSDLTSPGISQGHLSRLKSHKRANILELSKSHLVIQGMDVDDEGGLLVLWDLKFGFSVSFKALKMYKDPPLSWNIGSAVIVVQGGSLCLVPFEIRPSTIASMFGSKVSDKDIPEVDHCYGWSLESGDVGGASKRLPFKALSSGKSPAIIALVKQFSSGAFSEDIISRQVIKQAIQSKDCELIYDCLDYFSTIPEKSLLAILKYFLGISNEFLRTSLGIRLASFSERKNYNNLEELSESEELPPPLLPEKSEIVNKILLKPFSVKVMANHLPLMDFNASLDLINHLHYLLNSGNAQLISNPSTPQSIPSIQRSCLWLSLLLDANYHQLVMTSELDVHKKLLLCLNDVAALQNLLEYDIEPLIDQILQSKPIATHQANALYSVERLIIP